MKEVLYRMMINFSRHWLMEPLSISQLMWASWPDRYWISLTCKIFCPWIYFTVTFRHTFYFKEMCLKFPIKSYEKGAGSNFFILIKKDSQKILSTGEENQNPPMMKPSTRIPTQKKVVQYLYTSFQILHFWFISIERYGSFIIPSQ